MKRTSWPSARSAHARWHEQSRKWPERGGGGGRGKGKDGLREEASKEMKEERNNCRGFK